MTRLRRCPAGAFTLIELLVVIGIVATLATVVGLGLRGGEDRTALRLGRSILLSQINAARGQAGLRGSDTAVAVAEYAGDGGAKWRFVGVARQDDSGVWLAVSHPVELPGGVQFDSVALGGNSTSVVEFFRGGESTECRLVARFNGQGAVAKDSPAELWLQLVGGGGNRVGITISRYGVVTLLESAGHAEGAR